MGPLLVVCAICCLGNLLPLPASFVDRLVKSRLRGDGCGRRWESHRSQKKTRMPFFPLYAWFVAAAAEGPPPHQKLPPRACAYISLSLSPLSWASLSRIARALPPRFLLRRSDPRPLLLLLLLTRQSARGNRVRQTHLAVGGRERERIAVFRPTHAEIEREAHLGLSFSPFLLHRKTSRITGRRREEKEGRRF